LRAESFLGKTVRQFFSFGCVGAVATAAHYATLVALVHLGHLGPVASSGLGACVGALVNYRLNYSYTFRSDKRHREVVAKFLVVAAVGLLLNVALMGLLTRRLAVHYLVAQVIATAVVLFSNFTGHRLWSFREGPAVPPLGR
jgi:putative flippase GtrA